MYKRVVWKNHVTERPGTYTSTVNSDGTRTDTEAFGAIIQQGTPQNADNFNNAEDAIAHYAAAFDELVTMFSAVIRDQGQHIETLEAQLAALATSAASES